MENNCSDNWDNYYIVVMCTVHEILIYGIPGEYIILSIMGFIILIITMVTDGYIKH